MSLPQPPAAPANATPSAPEVLPRQVLLAYGAGSASTSLTEFAFSNLANPVFTVILGVSPALVGMLLTIGSLWNAFTQPLMGVISDNYRSRWGRRRPFILWGGLLAALSFAVVFFAPRGWQPSQYFVYLVVTSFIFSTASTIITVPYISLLPELSPSTRGRNQLAAVSTLFMRGVLLLMVWLFALTQLPWFTDSIQGVRVAGACVAVVSMATALWTFFGLREPHQERIQHQEKFSVFGGVRETFKLKPVYPLLVTDILIGIAGNLVNSVGFFLVVYYVQRGDLRGAAVSNGILGTVFLATSLLAVGPATTFVQKYGRLKVFYGCVAAIIAGSILKWFCFREGDATWIWVPFVLVGPGLCIATMILTAMKADITDWDELHTGQRREGMIGAVQSWINKTINAFNAGLAGYLLVFSHFDVQRGANQAPGTFLLLRVLFTSIPILFALIAVVTIRRFPINEARAAEMRRELERRRGV